MSDRHVAEVFPPGEFLREELDARGWTQLELAEVLGCTPRLVNEIINGKRGVTPQTATALGEAFDTGAQYWMNLQTAYQLAQLSPDKAVARRAILYSKAPVKEMIRRHWIEASDNLEVLEQRVLSFLNMTTLNDTPGFEAAARKSTSYRSLTSAQCAWLMRAKQLSHAVSATKFSKSKLETALGNLRSLLEYPQEARRVPKILGEGGIRLVIVEHLPETRIDGACFWLSASAPVVALSLRYDRIDWFWHTLIHEVGHIKKQDGHKTGLTLDTDLVGKDRAEFNDKLSSEAAADRFAAEFLVPQNELDDFISRTRPLYAKKKIMGFARRIGVHPGIVVGQLQYRGEISYAHSREMLVKVRESVTDSALTDGWGHYPVLN